MEMARLDGVPTCVTLESFLQVPNLDVIIEATGNPDVQEQLERNKVKSSAIVEAQGANLMMYVIEEKEKLADIKRLKGELDTVLNSVQEAIEVAGIDGKIKYVNPSFSRVTSIPANQRIGHNIFDVSPNGALAKALRTHEPVFAHRAQVGGTSVEVISNASPVVVDGKLEGAVVVFQSITDIYKLMEQLKVSNQVIDDLQSRINQISTSSYTFDDLIGSHPEFKSALDLARKGAKSNSTILISGESGTGKELFAHAIHGASLRLDKPFIKVNCAAIPETLLESEFFGHEKGAFTGALKTKHGKMELANGGTIFLDEIGDMKPYLQAKLLRVLQEMEFERVGGTQTIKVDVRVIAATNRNLLKMVKQGDFREDLYYRLNVLPIEAPPLRERIQDIPLLVEHFVARFNRLRKKKIKGVADEVMVRFARYTWPGNVRELENMLERMVILTGGDALSMMDLPERLLEGETVPRERFEEIPAQGFFLNTVLAEFEKRLILQALEQTDWVKNRAAKLLNVNRTTLIEKMKRFKLASSSVEM